MSKHSNTPELRFPEFDGEWEEKTLGDIGSVAMNKRIYKNETTNHGEIPFYKIGTFGKKAETFISREKFEEYKEKYPYPNKGDILISASGSIGRTVEYDGEEAYYQDSNIVWLQHNNEVLNVFLKYFYLIVKWNGIEGTTIKRLYNKNILNTKIKLPVKEEQQKIGEFFNKLDHQIELEEKKLELLEQQKRGYMQKIFSQELRFKDENGNDYPEWEEDFLYNIFSSYKGKGLSKDKISNEGKHNCILYGEIYTTYTEKIENIVSKTDYNEGFLSQENDLIFPSSTTTNAWDLATFVALKQKNVLLGGDISVLRSKRYKVSSLFYAYYLSNYLPIRREIAKYAQGITIVHLSFKSFNKIKVKIPSIKEQNVITNFIDHLNQNQTLIQRKINVLKQRKQGLLQKMFV